jgi:hypothetical protein
VSTRQRTGNEFVRKQLLDDIGGLPDYKGPLNARVTGQIHTDVFHD